MIYDYEWLAEMHINLFKFEHPILSKLYLLFDLGLFPEFGESMMEPHRIWSWHWTNCMYYECMENNASSHEKDSVAGGILPVFLFQAGEFITI